MKKDVCSPLKDSVIAVPLRISTKVSKSYDFISIYFKFIPAKRGPNVNRRIQTVVGIIALRNDFRDGMDMHKNSVHRDTVYLFALLTSCQLQQSTPAPRSR